MGTLIAEFTVHGKPIPQGSTRAFSRGGKIHTTNDPQGTIERWRGDIRTAAQPSLHRYLGPGLPVASPVSMRLVFRLPRPKAHYHAASSKRPAPELRADAPMAPSGGPDIDKLARAVLDALTAVVYRDDSQVASLGAVKLFADPGQPGVDITVVAL